MHAISADDSYDCGMSFVVARRWVSYESKVRVTPVDNS